MSDDKKIYVGSGKKIFDGKYAISISPDKIAPYIEEYNGKRFVKLTVEVKREPDQFGKDIAVTINLWKPDPSKKAAKTEPKKGFYDGVGNPTDDSDSGLPF